MFFIIQNDGAFNVKVLFGDDSRKSRRWACYEEFGLILFEFFIFRIVFITLKFDETYYEKCCYFIFSP